MSTNATRMDGALEAMKAMKGWGIVAAILMILIGICFFIKPIAVAGICIWLGVAGLLINGITKIVKYFTMPKPFRSGLSLILGILWICVAILLIYSGCKNGFTTTAAITGVVAVAIGFICLFSGIARIATSGQVKAMGGSQGWSIAGGILEIICGLLVLSAPILGFFALTIAFGIYLVIMGIALLITLITL